MCTVTALPRTRLTARATGVDPLLLRVVCNRDERLTRRRALPPVVRYLRGRRVIMPIDPESGGTWVGANDAGLVLALLNVNSSAALHGTSIGGCESRGGVIPSVADATTVTAAVGRLIDSRLERFNPFRLMIFDRYQLAECWLEGGRPRFRRAYIQGPVMRTSSSLGDAVVDPPRRTLFRQFFRSAADPLAAQNAFHDHQWLGREAVSIRMERGDARTVSRSVVELSQHMVALSYLDADAMEPVRVVLPLTESAATPVRRCS